MASQSCALPGPTACRWLERTSLVATALSLTVLFKLKFLKPAQGARQLLLGKLVQAVQRVDHCLQLVRGDAPELVQADRKSTRLNSSHVKISYAVFCLKKKI